MKKKYTADIQDTISTAEDIIEITKGTESSSHFVDLARRFEEEPECFEEIIDRLRDSERVGFMMDARSKYDSTSSYEKITLLQKGRVKRNKILKTISITFSAAASVALLLVGSHYLFITDTTEKNETDLAAAPLIIANDRAFNLNEMEERDILKLLSGEEGAIPDAADFTAGGIGQKVNTEIIIPNRFTYDLSLPDGSTIKLNGGTKLTILAERENERAFVLDGEGYFNVAKSELPFIVESKGTVVRVHGTRFNVSNYNGQQTRTLLVSGSVSVRTEENEVFLSPGEYAVSDSEITVTNVDPASYLGWTGGEFIYTNRPFREVIDELSAWYGIDIQTGIPVDNQLTTFYAKRNQPPAEIFELIEDAFDVKFIKKGENAYVIIR